jgi:hypothetical protein
MPDQIHDLEGGPDLKTIMLIAVPFLMAVLPAGLAGAQSAGFYMVAAATTQT